MMKPLPRRYRGETSGAECQYCGQPIPDTRRAGARFCSDRHRIDYNALGRKEAREDAAMRRYAAYLDSL